MARVTTRAPDDDDIALHAIYVIIYQSKLADKEIQNKYTVISLHTKTYTPYDRTAIS